MAQLKTSLRGLTIPQKIQRGRDVEAGLRGNVNLTNGTALADNIKAAADDLAAKETIHSDKQREAIQAGTDKDTSETNFDRVYAATGNDAERQIGDDESKLLSTNYKLQAEPGPSQEVGKVQNLTVTTGDEEGELDGHWDSVPGAQSYAGQICIGDTPDPAKWQYTKPLGRKSKATFDSLVSGTRYWIRIQAVGALGPGPWSDPVSRIAP